jgi:beta-galactosidase/beta-glucuronidase
LEPIEQYKRIPRDRWERSTDKLPAPARATMPADWSKTLGKNFLGRVRYCRTFQKPTGLDEGQRVWLVVEPPDSRGSVTLNDQILGVLSRGDSPARFDITGLLASHNRLEIVIEHPLLDCADAPNDDSNVHLPGGLVGEVRLEIEE